MLWINKEVRTDDLSTYYEFVWIMWCLADHGKNSSVIANSFRKGKLCALKMYLAALTKQITDTDN